MSIQSLINIAETLEINRRKVVGQQVTRSGVVKTTETPTRNPWRMTVSVSAMIEYANARSLMETIDYYDRAVYQDINFYTNPRLSWMWAYQGDMTVNQRSAVSISSFTGNQMVLTGLPTGSAGQFIFKAGDVFTVGTNPYPFTSVTDVVRGLGSTVTVTTNRPNFFISSVVGSGLTYGNSVDFRMIATSMPTYTIIPGRYIQINGALELHEFTGAIV
jgi:hypothetical protein